MAMNFEYIKTPSGILKLVEIVFVLIAMVIFRGGSIFNSFGDTVAANLFAIGVMVTSLIITPLLLVCYIMGRTEIQKTILEMALNFLLFVFLLSAGAVCVDAWQGVITYDKLLRKAKRQSLTMGTFTLFASLGYLADFILSIRNYRAE
ncbi:hypothetical protein SK128_015494 [Halocaridina rubra]|uniref:MARVEL domain-containing protein n=1 Tax=Halocaridina rubra TaxID=373956 RepID=A0AAN8WNF0_HALRR